jgi:glycosyltransferase involved in cell wall biosynthesis
MSARSLFAFHLGSNPGYAIEHYERLFYRAGMELAGGDPMGVHFAFRDYAAGAPRTLPEGFRNLATWDYSSADPARAREMARYASEHEIRIAVLFDCDPLHPLARELHRAGVRSVVSFWGAPLSGRTPGWKLVLKRLQNLAARGKADWVVCESGPMADSAALGRGFPASRTRVIHPGVDIHRFRPAATPGSFYAHDTLGFPRDRKLVIFTGHMEERKGVHVLVQAAVELLARRGRKDVAFLICGNRPGESARLEKIHAGLGLDELIRYGGYRADLPEIYPSCYAAVIPSTGWDSFTYGAMEMGASGLPVLASHLQGLVESVLDGETGLHFPPGDALALANQLERLLDDPALASRLGNGGRARCERELNLEAHYGRVLGFLREASLC